MFCLFVCLFLQCSSTLGDFLESSDTAPISSQIFHVSVVNDCYPHEDTNLHEQAHR